MKSRWTRSCVQHKLRNENKKQNDSEVIHRGVKIRNEGQVLPEGEPVRILGNMSTEGSGEETLRT